MRRRRMYAAILAVTMVSACVLEGCSIFPKEEEDRKVQYVESAAELEYEQEIVTVETITESEKIHANYQQTKDESLAFDYDDEVIHKVYVKRGDEVHAGDVIAQLDVTAVEDALRELEFQIAKNEKRKQNLAELMQYDLNQIAIQNRAGWYEEPKDYQEAIEETTKGYNEQTQSIDDELYIQYLKKADYEDTIAKSYLYATIDGTVSYVTLGIEGTKTKAGEAFVRIIDTSEMYFVADTKYAKNFKDGDTVMVTVGSDTYETIVAHNEEDENALYLTLTSTDVQLAYNAQGSFVYVKAEAVDALTVSWKSVHTSGDTSYVYQLDEDGVRKMTEVTTGITGNGRTEITSGLKAGDVIIKE